MADYRTNADLIAERLHAAGVRHAFGIPSGQVLAIIDAMRRVGIEFVLVSHEGAAGFMADVTGRVSGVPGVAVATVGPGATNLTTGIGNAWLDRSPALAITGQVATAQLGRRVQMRLDHQALYRPLTKASFQLAPDSVAPMIDEALALAGAEPPGPVHLDLPEDVAVLPAQVARSTGACWPHAAEAPPVRAWGSYWRGRAGRWRRSASACIAPARAPPCGASWRRTTCPSLRRTWQRAWCPRTTRCGSASSGGCAARPSRTTWRRPTSWSASATIP